MSFRVLIVPEDPTWDRYILKPLIETMLARLNKPQAKVKILENPRVQGLSDVKAKLAKVVDRHRHYQWLPLLVDADGNDRSEEFRSIEKRYTSPPMLCCAGVQEIEAWLLAGHIDRLPEPWSQIRAEVSLKETYFRPFMNQHGDLTRPGAGRETLMAATLNNYPGLLDRCPELATLETRIQETIP